ncbi:MAG: hypothetical protein ACLU38_05545 [Dysosmobacter sp.]
MVSALRDRYEARWSASPSRTRWSEVFKVIHRANKYIDENAPWALAKDRANRVPAGHGDVSTCWRPSASAPRC